LLLGIIIYSNLGLSYVNYVKLEGLLYIYRNL